MMEYPDITKPSLEHTIAVANTYDPVKAHAYYEAHKHLKGRKSGRSDRSAKSRVGKAAVATNLGRSSKAAQLAKATKQVNDLRQRLTKLNTELKKRVAEEAKKGRASKADKQQSAKEAAKPDTAAEKAKAARDAKQYRQKNQQQLKTKAAAATSGGSKPKGAADSPKPAGKSSVEDLKATIGKVRDQLTAAVARQRALR